MKTWGVWIALLLSLGVNVGVLATLASGRFRGEEPRSPRPARTEGGGAETGGAGRLDRLAEHLGVEDESRQAFVDLQRRFLGRVREHRAELQRIRSQLRREVASQRPDRERIRRLIDQAGREYAALDEAMIDNILDSRAHLSPGQHRRFMALVGRLRGQARWPEAGSDPGARR